MKKIILLAVLLWSTTLFAQTTSVMAEIQGYHSATEKLSSYAYVQVDKSFARSNIGLFALVAATPTYVEVYAGPTYHFEGSTDQKYVDIALGIGLETDPHPFRIAGSISFYSNPDASGKNTKGTFQGLANVEYGGSGHWYTGYITYNISNAFALGPHVQSYDGTWGLRMQYSKSAISFYLVPGYSPENKEKAILAGIQYFF